MNNQILKKIIIIFSIIFLYNINIGNAAEPFIRNYDSIQDVDINKLKKYTNSIQDGSGDINVKTINVSANIADTITINSDDGHWYNGTYYQFNYLGTMFGNDTYAYMSITIPETITTIDTLILNFTYSGVDSISNLDNETPTFIDESCVLNFTYETDTYSVTETNIIGTIDVTIKNYRYSLQLDSKNFKTGINYILISGNNPKLNGINSSRSDNPPTFTFYYKTTLDVDLSSVALLSDLIVDLENRVNLVEDSIPSKLSQLVNDSNFISYNDSLYFTLLNPTSLVADTNIINDTLLFNDTACWVIYGDSCNVDLNNYTYNYEVFFDTGLAAGTWGKSELFIYRDKARNLIAFKSAVYNFAEGNIEITFLRRR